jgi:hypothetical protein
MDAHQLPEAEEQEQVVGQDQPEHREGEELEEGEEAGEPLVAVHVPDRVEVHEEGDDRHHDEHRDRQVVEGDARLDPQRARVDDRRREPVLLARPAPPRVGEAALARAVRGRRRRLVVEHGVLEEGERGEQRDADGQQRHDVAARPREVRAERDGVEEEPGERQQQDGERVEARRRVVEEVHPSPRFSRAAGRAC